MRTVVVAASTQPVRTDRGLTLVPDVAFYACVSAGIDSALTLAAELMGEDAAQSIQLPSSTTLHRRSPPARRSRRRPTSWSGFVQPVVSSSDTADCERARCALTRAATRLWVRCGSVPDADLASGRLRAAREMLAGSPWCRSDVERDIAGVPRVAWEPDGGIAVSWSRCRDELAVAFADHGPLGIDLEVITGRRPPQRELALVLRHCTVSLRGRDCDGWCEWTATEALAKAARCGLRGLATGRLRVVASIVMPPDAGCGAGTAPPLPTAVLAVTTVRASGTASPQEWQVRHHHAASRRLSVVIPYYIPVTKESIDVL